MAFSNSYHVMCILGVGASATWKEGNRSPGLLEWFAWPEAVEITIEGKICIRVTAKDAERNRAKKLYAVLGLYTFCKGPSLGNFSGVDRDGLNFMDFTPHFVPCSVKSGIEIIIFQITMLICIISQLKA